MFRALLPALLVLFAAGCARPQQTAATRASAATAASCRSSANKAFDRQNRYLLSERSTVDSPFSTSGDPGVTTRGLTQRFDYDTNLQSCLSNAAGPTGATNGPGAFQPGVGGTTSLSPF